MKLKRTIGTGKIFLYSCGAVIALAGVIWLIINGIYAVHISGEKPEKGWLSAFEKSSVDIVTPWLLMAAAMMIYYRYWKMCNANSISSTKQTGVFFLLSLFVSAAFAAADLLAAKLVFEKLYGNIVCTQFEDKSKYFFKLILNYVCSLDEDVTEISSPYTMKIILLLFALMAVYYYCFFLAGCYIMQCFRYGRKRILIYYAVTMALWIFLIIFVSEIDLVSGNPILNVFLAFIILAVIIIGALTNPVIFLLTLLYLIVWGFGSVILSFVMMTVFILITVLCIEILGLKQFPSKKQIKKILKITTQK